MLKSLPALIAALALATPATAAPLAEGDLLVDDYGCAMAIMDDLAMIYRALKTPPPGFTAAMQKDADMLRGKAETGLAFYIARLQTKDPAQLKPTMEDRLTQLRKVPNKDRFDVLTFCLKRSDYARDAFLSSLTGDT